MKKIDYLMMTHYHADHIGGSIREVPIAGIVSLLENIDVPVHVQRAETPWITAALGIEQSSLVEHDSGDIELIGDVSFALVHTPGHTPGSQCIVVDDVLLTGDTLFLDGCGRTDFPGGDPEELDRLIGRVKQLREEEGKTGPFEIHVISADGFTLDGIKRLEDKGVTDVIVGFRIPYIMGTDTEPLDTKIRNLERFAEKVIAKA